MTYLRLELKVCEACGTLWLRSQKNTAYCTCCAERLQHFPKRAKHAGGRPRRAARTITRGAAHVAGGAR